MTAAAFRPEDFEISEEDIAAAPPAVLKLLSFLISEVTRLRKRVEELEAKLGEDSSNSNKPPSTDSPYKEKRQGEPVTKPRKKRRGCSSGADAADRDTGNSSFHLLLRLRQLQEYAGNIISISMLSCRKS